MYEGLKRAYPSITFISSYYNENPFKYSPNITIDSKSLPLTLSTAVADTLTSPFRCYV